MKHVCNPLCGEGYHALLYSFPAGAPDTYFSQVETFGRMLAGILDFDWVSSQPVPGPAMPYAGNIAQQRQHGLTWARDPLEGKQ